MKAVLRRRTLWLAVNAAGIAVYLYLASKLWVVPGEEGTPGGPGEAFYWLLCLVPVLGLFLTFNIVALFAVLLRGSAKRLSVALLVWAIVASLWVGTLAVDHYRSIRYVDAQYA